MAVLLSVDCNCHLYSSSKHFSLAINPKTRNFNSHKPSINPRKHEPSLCSSINAIRRQRIRRQLLPKVNCLEEDSELPRNSAEDEKANNLGVRAALSILRFYKREISPLLPKSCRYVPTCSEYSMIAYKKYGFVKGTILTTWRLCRCNPLGGSGFDPPRWFNEASPPDQ